MDKCAFAQRSHWHCMQYQGLQTDLEYYASLYDCYETVSVFVNLEVKKCRQFGHAYLFALQLNLEEGMKLWQAKTL